MRPAFGSGEKFTAGQYCDGTQPPCPGVGQASNQATEVDQADAGRPTHPDRSGARHPRGASCFSSHEPGGTTTVNFASRSQTNRPKTHSCFFVAGTQCSTGPTEATPPARARCWKSSKGNKRRRSAVEEFQDRRTPEERRGQELEPERNRMIRRTATKNACKRQDRARRSPAEPGPGPTAGRASGRPVPGWSAAEARLYGYSTNRCGMLESVSSRMFTKQRVHTPRVWILCFFPRDPVRIGTVGPSRQLQWNSGEFRLLAGHLFDGTGPWGCEALTADDQPREHGSCGRLPPRSRNLFTSPARHSGLAHPQGPLSRTKTADRARSGESPQCSPGLVIQPPARHLCAKASFFNRGCLRTGGRMVPWRPGERRRPRMWSGSSCTGKV